MRLLSIIRRSAFFYWDLRENGIREAWPGPAPRPLQQKKRPRPISERGRFHAAGNIPRPAIAGYMPERASPRFG